MFEKFLEKYLAMELLKLNDIRNFDQCIENSKKAVEAINSVKEQLMGSFNPFSGRMPVERQKIPDVPCQENLAYEIPSIGESTNIQKWKYNPEKAAVADRINKTDKENKMPYNEKDPIIPPPKPDDIFSPSSTLTDDLKKQAAIFREIYDDASSIQKNFVAMRTEIYKQMQEMNMNVLEMQQKMYSALTLLK